MDTPNARRPLRCKSIGRWPISQPPGYVTAARRNRPRMEPIIKMEERSDLERCRGISQPLASAASMETSAPSRFQRQPSVPRIASILSTSAIRGQLSTATGSPAHSAAARMGSTAFLAARTRAVPAMRLPPVMRYTSTDHTPHDSQPHHQGMTREGNACMGAMRRSGALH